MRTKTTQGDEAILIVSFAEIELLYDGLDALNDRYEQFEESEDPEDKVKAQKDLQALGKLNDDFQEVIKIVRAPKFGTQLPNGAIVIEVRGGVLLAKNNAGTKDEYVTWRWDGEDLHSTSHGHYFEELTDAVMDFIDRAEQEAGRAGQPKGG